MRYIIHVKNQRYTLVLYDPSRITKNPMYENNIINTNKGKCLPPKMKANFNA